jgi:hypothetical protein
VVFTFGTSSSDDASDKDKEDSVANVATDVDFLNTAGDDSAAATLLLLTTGIIELYLLLLLLRTIMAIHRVLTRGGVGSGRTDTSTFDVVKKMTMRFRGKNGANYWQKFLIFFSSFLTFFSKERE